MGVFQIWAVFRRTRKPGGFHGFSRTRKTSGTAGFLRVCKNDPKAQESLGCGCFLLFFIIFHGVEAPAKWRRNVCFPWEILGIFRRTRKPGGFHGFSRTRKSVGHACFFRVEDVYLNLGRHKTPLSFIIHSHPVGLRPKIV